MRGWRINPLFGREVIRLATGTRPDYSAIVTELTDSSTDSSTDRDREPKDSDLIRGWRLG